MRTTYIVCYDIASDRRREGVFKLCKNHGTHLQYSVFECDLSQMELTGLQRAILDILVPDEDQVLFVALGPAEGRGSRRIVALGKPYTKWDAPCYVM